MQTVTPSALRVALAELIEQASREDDGNFFSGATVGIFGGVLTVRFADSEATPAAESFAIAVIETQTQRIRKLNTTIRASLTTVPRDSAGRIEFPAEAWRDDMETRANLSRIIEEDDTDAARQWYEERAR